MIINLTGKKIRLTNTIKSDIDTIIEFENINIQYINYYPVKKYHLRFLRLNFIRLPKQVMRFQ